MTGCFYVFCQNLNKLLKEGKRMVTPPYGSPQVDFRLYARTIELLSQGTSIGREVRYSFALPYLRNDEVILDETKLFTINAKQGPLLPEGTPLEIIAIYGDPARSLDWPSSKEDAAAIDRICEPYLVWGVRLPQTSPFFSSFTEGRYQTGVVYDVAKSAKDRKKYYSSLPVSLQKQEHATALLYPIDEIIDTEPIPERKHRRMKGRGISDRILSHVNEIRIFAHPVLEPRVLGEAY